MSLTTRVPRVFKSWNSIFKFTVAPSILLYVLWRTFFYDPYYVPIYRYENRNLPPIYPALKDRERKLPQHNERLPFPEGKHGRFLRVGNQGWGSGLNNQFQEIFMNLYIAHLSNRAYVFTPFTWDPFTWDDFVPIKENSHLADSGYTVRPARIPLSAYVDSPLTGAPWPAGDHAPRSISLEWWDHVCKEEDKLFVNTTIVNAELGIDINNDDGSIIVSKWIKYLKELEHGCVNILWDTQRVVDYLMFGSDRVLSLWNDYSKHPALTTFQWSPIVRGAVERILPTMAGEQRTTSRLFGPKPSHDLPYIPGLVTMHLRRGDFYDHCSWMKDFAEPNGWNRLPFLPDRWHPPADNPERSNYIFSRCWIEISQIIAKLEELRAPQTRELQMYSSVMESKSLNRAFIMTNADAKWIEELKAAGSEKGWHILTTRDLDLTWQERGVDTAIDMEIASRGEIFVGNAISSMSSTVTRMRLVRGVPAPLTRFW